MRQLIEDLISMMEYHVEQTRPIYTTTVALEAAREALKSLPQQRTWVGLTDEEINQAYADSYKGVPLHEGIEAKLKEKNTWKPMTSG